MQQSLNNKKRRGCIRTRTGFSGFEAVSIYMWELNLRLEIPRQNLFSGEIPPPKRKDEVASFLYSPSFFFEPSAIHRKSTILHHRFKTHETENPHVFCTFSLSTLYFLWLTLFSAYAIIDSMTITNRMEKNDERKRTYFILKQ